MLPLLSHIMLCLSLAGLAVFSSRNTPPRTRRIIFASFSLFGLLIIGFHAFVSAAGYVEWLVLRFSILTFFRIVLCGVVLVASFVLSLLGMSLLLGPASELYQKTSDAPSMETEDGPLYWMSNFWMAFLFYSGAILAISMILDQAKHSSLTLSLAYQTGFSAFDLTLLLAFAFGCLLMIIGGDINLKRTPGPDAKEA